MNRDISLLRVLGILNWIEDDEDALPIIVDAVYEHLFDEQTIWDFREFDVPYVVLEYFGPNGFGEKSGELSWYTLASNELYEEVESDPNYFLLRMADYGNCIEVSESRLLSFISIWCSNVRNAMKTKLEQY